MENKKLIEERRIECVGYKEEECFHLGKYSGRCFKYSNPLRDLLCKEVKKGRLQSKE